jgi:hypothetical protein|tara:strand:+ start:53 stop:628 length:576 start_codon:yes stop_codon:yes gene_type:complete
MATGFWTQGQQQDPKRQYRFVANFTGLGNSGCSWFVKNVDKPNVSISEASHEYLNHTFYYPGRISWNSVSVTFVDPVDPDATATMMQAINNAGYKIPTSPDSLGTLSKSKSIDSLGTVTIKQVDSEGIAVEEWKLNNAWIKSVNLSGLDYGGDSLSEVTVEIRYDWATLSAHGATANVNGPAGKDDGIWTL